MGFWDSLFKSRPIDSAALNKVDIPGERNSPEAIDTRDFSEEYASEQEVIDIPDFSKEYATERKAADTPDFSEEYASELYADNGMDTDNSYSQNGVSLKETTKVFRLTYDGILARDGAQDVYAVVVYEDNGSWKNTKYYPMQKTDGQAYEVLFPATGHGNINVAFKDGADHWDNNSGRNYTYVNEGG